MDSVSYRLIHVILHLVLLQPGGAASEVHYDKRGIADNVHDDHQQPGDWGGGGGGGGRACVQLILATSKLTRPRSS